MTHDEAAIRLREAIQGKEESSVAMNSVIAEREADFKDEGSTSILSPPCQVS